MQTRKSNPLILFAYPAAQASAEAEAFTNNIERFMPLQTEKLILEIKPTRVC